MSQSSNLLRIGAPLLIVAVVLIVAIAGVVARDAGDGDVQITDPGDVYQVEAVNIESVEVLLAESYPVQVFVEVRGYLPDPCWNAQEPVIEQDGNRIEIEIVAERKVDEVCPQVIQDYDASIPLGTMDPGTYVVSVNGVEQEFEVH